MNEKVINEFTVKVNKAKNYLQDLTSQCEQLKREAERLKKELDIADNEKLHAEKINDNLKKKFISSKAITDEGI